MLPRASSRLSRKAYPGAIVDEIVSITARVSGADEFLFTVPMWNGGIP
jgi:hypothetical protein